MCKNNYSNLLSKELVVALGCTEPAAIALAASKAKKYLKKGSIESIVVRASSNVIKNAANVKIPGTDSAGINLAAAIGAVKEGENADVLEVFSELDAAELKRARDLVNEGRVSVDVAQTEEKLFIEVTIKTSVSTARAVVEKAHTHISLIEADGEVVEKNSFDTGRQNESFSSIDTIWEYINTIELTELGIISYAIELNRKIGLEGLENIYGLQVGRTILEKAENGIIPDDIISYAMALTSAGCDARMAGAPFRVMSNSGSGNQGIVATLPVLAAWEKLKLPEEKLIRAVALSNLITIHIKHKFGRISALCGATMAAAGASCGIAYLMNGNVENIKSAIQNIAGNLTGMLCDGAKAGCALKVSTCASAAGLSAIMAVNGISIASTDGIIDDNPEKTIENISTLGNEGVLEADRIMLSILLNKENAKNSESTSTESI